MTHIVSSDLVVMLSVLVSILVLFYVVGYLAMAYVQYKQGTLRPDWKISIVFYAGIILLTLGYLFNLIHTCFGTVCINELFDEFYLVSLVLFAWGFELRAGYAAKLACEVQGGKKKKGGKGA